MAEKQLSPATAPTALTATLPPPPPSDSASSTLTQNPIIASIKSVYDGFHAKRRAMGLSNPGALEDISREVSRSVFLNNLMFSGFRAEFTKAFSNSPLFQTAHSFAMGGNGGMPAYSFAALFGNPNMFLQGQIDNEYALSARYNYRFFPGFTAKSSLSLQPGSSGAQQSMLSVEADYAGDDFHANVKAMNPSILDNDVFTGAVVASYMQSVTPSLSLGLETMYQRPAAEEGPNTAVSYAARYKGVDWIASAQFLSQGVIQGTYWRRLAEKVEAGLDINMSFLGLLAGMAGGAGNPMMGQMKNEGSATFGAKYEFRTSVFRGQVDSQGKVSALLEKQIAPMIRFTFAGEMDHAKNATKMGMMLAIESAGSDEFLEAQERAMQLGQAPPQGDVPPF